MSLSVAIITYNQEDHVEQTVRSFCDQELDIPLQVIVCDDASRDGTPDVLRRLGEEYGDRLVLMLNEQNLGITGNSNRALHAATGEFFALTGGDDIALPGRLQRQVDALRAHPTAGACVCATQAFDSDTGAPIRVIDPTTTFGRTRFEARDFVRYGNIGASPAYLFRRGATPDHYDSQLPIVSDMLFNLETAHDSWLLAIPDVLVRYRVHPQASSSTTHGADPFVTEGLIAARYPDLVPWLGHLRARAYRTEALRRLLRGRPTEARPYFAASFRARPNLRALAGTALCTLPEPAVRRILYRYNPLLKSRYDG